MQVIYQPKGRAAEYADLAANLYRGCSHGCKYCYAPRVLRIKDRDQFDAAVPRKDVIKQLRKDAAKYANTPLRVLMSFTTDPYQPAEFDHGLTKQAIEIMGTANIPMNVLTKSPLRAFYRDAERFKHFGLHFGTSISFSSDTDRQEWEPSAESVADRCKAMKLAHEKGIPTWVSIEPVIIPDQARDIIEATCEYVDFYKIGKLNHDAALEASINWNHLLRGVLLELSKAKASYRIKDELWAFADPDTRRWWKQKRGDSRDMVGEKGESK